MKRGITYLTLASCCSMAGKSVARGEHTIRVVIVDQASSPNSHTVGSAVTLPDRIMDLAPLQGLVATGESLSIRITV
jgi:hypothetical protein